MIEHKNTLFASANYFSISPPKISNIVCLKFVLTTAFCHQKKTQKEVEHVCLWTCGSNKLAYIAGWFSTCCSADRQGTFESFTWKFLHVCVHEKYILVQQGINWRPGIKFNAVERRRRYSISIETRNQDSVSNAKTRRSMMFFYSLRCKQIGNKQAAFFWLFSAARKIRIFIGLERIIMQINNWISPEKVNIPTFGAKNPNIPTKSRDIRYSFWHAHSELK